MSCWDDIDRLKAQHAEELRQTTNALEALRAIKGSVDVNEFGLWECRYIPKGERTQSTVSARTGGGARREAQGDSRGRRAAEGAGALS